MFWDKNCPWEDQPVWDIFCPKQADFVRDNFAGISHEVFAEKIRLLWFWGTEAAFGIAAVSAADCSDGRPGSEWMRAGGRGGRRGDFRSGSICRGVTAVFRRQPDGRGGGFFPGAGISVTEDGEYTSRDEVAAYLHAFGHLPSNYITKREAEAAGWDPKAGNLGEVAPGKSIGGSRFGNYEGSLPEADGRKYFECDIDYDGGSRNAKRIVYSSDGLIFYTDDHYRTLERLY